MEKTILEKRILEKAEERTKKEYEDFINFLQKNDFGRELEVFVNDETSIPISNFGCNYGLFNHDCLRNRNVNITNLEKVYNEILEKNIKIVTDEILNKLKSIEYLFNQ